MENRKDSSRKPTPEPKKGKGTVEKDPKEVELQVDELEERIAPFAF